jgi:hypothetical protein
MVDLRDGLAYAPMQAYDKSLVDVSNFCFDLAKWNLAWLAEPRMDDEGVKALVKNPIAAAIDEFMDKDTRAHLSKPPLTFMKYWLDLHKQGQPIISAGWPETTLATMEMRAQDAHERLFGLTTEGNVVFAKFGRPS